MNDDVARSIVCPWCKATGTDSCRTSDGQKRVPHRARARMTKAARLYRPVPTADTEAP